MLSGGDGDVPDGIGMARLQWSRLPTTEADGASASAAADDELLFAGAAVESLDYEVIENYAYREEQVRAARPSAEAVLLKPRSFPFLVPVLLVRA
jgi:chloride channel 7